MNKSSLTFLSKLSVIILCILGLTELALALWTVFDNRYKSLAFNLADVGYIVRKNKQKKNIYMFLFIDSFIGSMDIKIFIIMFICFIDYNISYVFNFNMGFMFSTCIFIYCINNDCSHSYWRIYYIDTYIYE